MAGEVYVDFAVKLKIFCPFPHLPLYLLVGSAKPIPEASSVALS
jgi:hypothetical protein